MEGLAFILAIILGSIWAIVFVVIQIWYLIALFRADWVLALVSLFFPPVALFILIKNWEYLKRPFLANLFTVIIGAVGAIAFIFIIGAIGAAQDADPPPDIPEVTLPAEDEESIIEENAQPAIQPIKPVQPAAPTPTWGTTTSVDSKATIIIPEGWLRMTWQIPHIKLAMGNPKRGEFTTVHTLSKDSGRSLEELQQLALVIVRQHVIVGGEVTTSTKKTLSVGPYITDSLSGRSKLIDQNGKPTALRIVSVQGEQHDYFLIQWRNAAWDDDTIEILGKVLTSLKEQP